MTFPVKRDEARRTPVPFFLPPSQVQQAVPIQVAQQAIQANLPPLKREEARRTPVPFFLPPSQVQQAVPIQVAQQAIQANLPPPPFSGQRPFHNPRQVCAIPMPGPAISAPLPAPSAVVVDPRNNSRVQVGGGHVAQIPRHF